MLADYPIQGPPDLTREQSRKILRDGNSPALAESDSMYLALTNADVRPAVLLAFFWVESRFGTVGVAKDYDTKNPGNVRSSERATATRTIVQTPRGPFAKYPTWADGTADWAARMMGPKYAGAGLTTVRQVLPKYAPSTDSNDPDAYARTVLSLIDDWTKGGPPVALQQPTIDASHPSPNRNGYTGTRRADAVTWHITEGVNSLGWLTSPVSGASSNYLLSRVGTIYELVPPTEDAWANGDVQKPNLANPLIAKWVAERVNFNQRTISIEHEGFTSKGKGGSLTAAQVAATVRLTAWLCDHFGIAPDRDHIMPHAWINSVTRPNCPGFSAWEWTTWVDAIDELVRAGTGGGDEVQIPERGTAVSYLTEDGQPVTVVTWDGELAKIDGTAFVDLGISGTNKQGEKWDRSLVNGEMKPWVKRP